MGCTGTPSRAHAICQTHSPPVYKSPQTPPAVSFDRTYDTGSTKSLPSASAAGDSTGSTNETSSMSTFLAEQSRKEDRTLYSTTVHGPHELVSMLYTAIKIARSKNKESTTEIFRLEASKSHELPKALRAVNGEKENYCWGKLRATLCSRIVSKKRQSAQIPIDSNDADSYYIIGILGHGSTSNVFQALTSDGEHVAIKVSVKNYNDHGEILDESSFQMIANEAVEREKERLLSFYPELFKDKVMTAKLFCRPCIVVPFIHPLTKSERKHHATWTSMKHLLREQFLPRRLRYKQDDESQRILHRRTRVALSKTQWTISKLASALIEKRSALSMSKETNQECSEFVNFKQTNTTTLWNPELTRSRDKMNNDQQFSFWSSKPLSVGGRLFDVSCAYERFAHASSQI